LLRRSRIRPSPDAPSRADRVSHHILICDQADNGGDPLRHDQEHKDGITRSRVLLASPLLRLTGLGWSVGMTSSADRTAAHSRHRVHAQPMFVEVFMDGEDRPVMAWLPRPVVISYRLTSNPIGRQRCRQPAL
jgi:hypothetical protein